MNSMIYKGRKTKVTAVPYGRRRFLAWIIMLMFCLCLFSSDAMALYRIISTGDSYVSGLESSGSYTWDGNDFGSPSLPGWVIGIANYEEGYGIFADGGSLTITGDLSNGSTIGGVAGDYHAYGLYSSEGDSIHTGDLNGFIYAITGYNRAVGLYSEDGDVNTGDIGGRIEATAGTHDAYGLRTDDGDIITGDISGEIIIIADTDRAVGFRSHSGSIETGDIDGTIDVTAGGHKAYGLRSDYDIITGNINGEITAIAEEYNAYGLYSGGGDSIHINGNVNGTISADVNDGYNAYAMYSYGDIIIDGNIGSDAEITATINHGGGAGGLRSNGSIDVCDIDGTITVTADRHAYGLRTDGGNITTGAINGDISTTVEGVRAYGLYSNGGSISTGDVNGTITATAGARAYGLRSDDGSISTGDINGDITATASTGYYAYGLYSDFNSITTGDINGTITAFAEYGDAYGLYSGGGSSIHTGDINGIISAEANDGYWAYAIYSVNDITVENIGSDANISARAEYDYAYGVYSEIGDVNIGDIDGKISAEVNDGSVAHAIHSGSNITIGNIGSTAEITATATGKGAKKSAYGMYSGDSLTILDINGTISAEMTNGYDAYAIYAVNDITVGNIYSDANISATAGQSYAYGLFSAWGDVNTGDIDGTIDANAGGNNARGLFGWGSITTGDINGVITATAGGEEAAGLYSADGSIDTNDINGNITATAVGDWAYGLRTHSGSITTDAIDGNITATTGGDIARGLGAWGDITTGDINGKITADANGYNAAAVYSWSSVTIDGNIGSSANISATAGDSYAYGLYSEGSITTGDINGVISATAATNSAYALWSGGSIYTGEINGTITAEAGTSWAVGLYTGDGDSIYTGDINGVISADVNGGSWAAAMYSSSDITTGDIDSDANIIATAGVDNAFGFYSNSGDVNTGAIDGTITATAGQNWAVGLYADNGSIITGDITGAISATAEQDDAYGFWGDGGDITTGDINGIISATAGDSRAGGLYNSYGSVITGDIGSDANITATASDGYAYGLYSGGGSSIHTGDINGIISADVNDGSNAYAMYSWSDITTGDIGSDGNISATVGQNRAYGLCSQTGDVNTGDIDGNISATAGGYWARGLWSGQSIYTGDINGVITATAGTYDARGLYSYNGSIETGDINGMITATAETWRAYGLYSNGSIETGDINGVITADVNDGSNAYGMYSWSDITTGDIGSDANISATAGSSMAYGLCSQTGDVNTGDIDGNISANAGGYWARGLWSGQSIYTGAINGTISAMAEDGDARALYSYNGSIQTGDINGKISADVNDGSWAVALYSDSNITTGDIGSDARITATAWDDRAYGLCSQTGDVNTGDIDGMIDANAGGDYARGVWSWQSIYTGDINGVITATAGGDYAAGLYSDNNSITSGDINGVITATAGDSWAAGLYSGGGDVNIGNIEGAISATAEQDGAYGVYVSSGVLTTGDITGEITATAGRDSAYGLNNSDGLLTTGDITGTITVTAEDYWAAGVCSDGPMNIGNINGTISADVNNGPSAYALYASSDLRIEGIGSDANIIATAAQDSAYGIYGDSSLTIGAIDGTITASADTNEAYGLLSDGTLTTCAIGGTIDVNAGGDFAYGIMSYGPIDTFVEGGTVSAVAVTGPNVAAIQSGRISGGTLQTTDANDTVGITAGSVIVGDIDLAMDDTDEDILTLSAGVDTDSNTTFDDDIKNIERIYITGGTWYINGTVSENANGIRMSGGILKGTGTMEDLYVGAETLAPGGSIGTMYVGNLTFSPDSTFEVEVDDFNNADLVVASGWADLNDATINCEVFGDERIDHSFSATVIDANTGLYPSFAEPVTSSMIFPIYDVEYDTYNYDVILNVTFDYAYYADTDNQHSVGEAFNCIVVNGLDTGDMNDVLWTIEHLPDGDAANEAYNQMMPQDMLGLPDVTRRVMNQHNDSIMSRMDNLRRGRQYVSLKNNRYLLASADNTAALPTKTGTDEWMPFAKGIGVWGDRDEASDIAGYKYSVYGAVAGMDKLVSDNSLLGFGIGYATTKVDYSRPGTDADIESLLFSLHGSYFEDDWHLDWTAAYGHNSYDLQRKINFDSINRTAKSDHKGNAYSAAIEFGKYFGDDSMILEPIAGMGYTYVKEKGYTESGAESLNLDVDSDTSDGFYSKLGVRVAKEIRSEDHPNMVIVPKVSAFWIHDFADRVELDSSFVGGCSFKTKGLDPVRNMFNVGAGLNVYFSNNLRVFADYTWQSAGDFDSSMAQAGVQWSF